MSATQKPLRDKVLAGLSELFAFTFGKQPLEHDTGLTLREAMRFAAFQLVVQLILLSAPAFVLAPNAGSVAPFPIIIDLLGNMVIYAGVIAAAVLVERRDRIPLMIFGVAVVALLLSVTEAVVGSFTDQARSLLGVLAFFLFMICRNGLRIGILVSIVSAIGIVLASVLVKAAFILQMIDATPAA